MLRVWIRTVAALAVLTLPTVASAQQALRVMLGPVSGRGSDTARQALSTMLGEHRTEVEVVPSFEYAAAADRLRIRGSSDEDVALVGREVHVDAVLVGQLTQRRRRGPWVLRVRLVRSADGQPAGTTSSEIRRPSEVTDIRGEIWDQLRPFFANAAPGATPPARLNPDAGAAASNPSNTSGAAGPQRTLPSGAIGATSGSSPGTAATVRTTPNRGSGTTGGTAGVSPSARDGTTEGPPVPPPVQAQDVPRAGTVRVPATPGLGWLTLSVGGAGALRFWRMAVLGEVSPRGYENTGYPELQASATVLARFAQERVGIGGAVAVEFPLSLASRATNELGEVVSLPTSALAITAGVVAAYRPPGGGTMQLTLGGFFHDFHVDTTGLPLEQRLARTRYLGGRFAAEGILPLYAGPVLELGVLFGGELRAGPTGDELRAAFGRNGPWTIGLGGTLGIQLRLDGVLPGLAFRVTGEMLRYRSSFAGNADIGPGSDSIDDFIRGQLGVSYAFGSRRP